MRDRLITALVGLAIAVIVLYGGPRAYMVAEQAQTTVVQQTERSADLIAAVLTERSRGGGPVDEDLDALVHDGEVLVHRGADGRIVASAGEAEGHAADVVATRRLPDGSALELTRSGAAVSERITDAVMPIVLIGLGVVVLAVLAAVVLARGLARPFQRLADAARRLGDGTFSLPPMDSTLPEARAIGVALQTSSRQLEALLHRERQFAANASHQLRTPLTALRLELEDLTYWPETAPAVSEQLHRALGELDRLSGTVTELLEHSRGRRLERPVPVDLALLTAETAAPSRRWHRVPPASARIPGCCSRSWTCSSTTPCGTAAESCAYGPGMPARTGRSRSRTRGTDPRARASSTATSAPGKGARASG